MQVQRTNVFLFYWRFQNRKKVANSLDSRDGVRLVELGLGERAGGDDLLFWLDDGNVVGERSLGSVLALRIPRQHNLDPERRIKAKVSVMHWNRHQNSSTAWWSTLVTHATTTSMSHADTFFCVRVSLESSMLLNLKSLIVFFAIRILEHEPSVVKIEF